MFQNRARFFNITFFYSLFFCAVVSAVSWNNLIDLSLETFKALKPH